MQTTVIHDGATARLDDPDGTLTLFATSPAARRAAARLVAQHHARWRIGICAMAVCIGIILAVAAFVAERDVLYGLAAAAQLLATVGWCMWFQEWR